MVPEIKVRPLKSLVVPVLALATGLDGTQNASKTDEQFTTVQIHALLFPVCFPFSNILAALCDLYRVDVS